MRTEIQIEWGGKLEPGKYFSGQTVTPFYGISYVIKDDLIFKIEKDPTDTEGSRLKFDERNSDYSISLDYSFNDYFDIGFSYERGNYFSIRFVYNNDPLQFKNMNIKNLKQDLEKINILNW